MSRGGIILQPILFAPAVVTLSAVGPPPPGEVGGPGGGGSAVGPILAGLLLALGALGFPGAAVPPTTPGPPAAGAPSPGPSAPPAAVAPGQVPPAPPAISPGGPAPSRQAPLVLGSVPRQGPPGAAVPGPGPAAAAGRRRPVLPFTGANLLTPMVVGAALIALGLLLRRVAKPPGVG